MKKVVMNESMQGMVKHLDNSQMKMLYNVLERSFEGIEISKTEFQRPNQSQDYLYLLWWVYSQSKGFNKVWFQDKMGAEE